MELFERNNYLEQLPTELKMMIMQNLEKEDLCSLALVSNNIKTVALDPSLWPELTINTNEYITKKLDKGGIESLLVKNKRFSNLKSLIIQPQNFSQDPLAKLSTQQLVSILEIVLKSNSLIELDLKYYDLSELPLDILSGVIKKMRKVTLYDTNLSDEQLVSILEAIVDSNSLIDLNLIQFNKPNSLIDVNLIRKPEIPKDILSELPLDILKGVIKKQRKVTLYNTVLSCEQLVSILEAIDDSNSLIDLKLIKKTVDNNKDFVTAYTSVRNVEQRIKYKMDFEEHYNNYRNLHSILDMVSKRFSELEDKLKLHHRDSPQFKRVQAQIVSEYAKNKEDADYQNARHQFQYLHEKLAHIKLLVHNYDTNAQ